MVNGNSESFTRALYLIIAACFGYILNDRHRESLSPDPNKITIDLDSLNTYKLHDIHTVKPSYKPPKSNDSWSFRQTMFCKAEHTSRLIRKRQKDVEKTNIFERFQDLKNLIRDPDSTFTWADYCTEFNSNFFDLSKRAVSLGTAEIKMKTGCNSFFSILYPSFCNHYVVNLNQLIARS